jgi:hypothetical protein
MGSILFGVKEKLELISKNLSKIRKEGIDPSGMVPLSIIVSETKLNSAINNIEDVIQILAKVPNNLIDRKI